jgi:hypothetical protein
MLRQDVIDSVEAGEFHIYPVDHIDEGIHILTGIKAGESKEDGTYPEGTINAMVKERLEKMANQLTEYGKGKGDKSD